MVSGSLLLTALVQLVVAGLIIWLLYWFIERVGLPEPFHKVAVVLLALATVVLLINVLMSLTGTPLVRWG